MPMAVPNANVRWMRIVSEVGVQQAEETNFDSGFRRIYFVEQVKESCEIASCLWWLA